MPFANAQIEGVTTPCFATGLPLKNNGCRSDQPKLLFLLVSAVVIEPTTL
jgi:hypothetical protein